MKGAMIGGRVAAVSTGQHDEGICHGGDGDR